MASGKTAARRLRVRQVRSGIGFSHDQKATLRALGLAKLHRVREHADTPQIRGMIAKIRHLVDVEIVGGNDTKGKPA